MVEKQLSSHIHEPSALIRAVLQSERMQSTKRLDWSVSLEPERGAIFHAEGALKAWEAANEFEKRLLADEFLAGDFLKS